MVRPAQHTDGSTIRWVRGGGGWQPFCGAQGTAPEILRIAPKCLSGSHAFATAHEVSAETHCDNRGGVAT
eukprot:7096819-Alexandrium_andersonii.AAC.1